MRVTNLMTSNQLLLNLNKSMTTLNFLQYQSATGNKIRYASDNPIIAGRSLKFRTNIVEVEQYLANVDQGRAWLQTSGNAVKNVMEALVNSGETSIRSLLVSAGGVNTISDSKIYANQLKETLNEILGELNTSYAGRYVFSGFKTDEKAVFDVDYPNKQVDITETFSFEDIQTEFKVDVRTDPSGVYDELEMPQELSCKRIKLAYEDGITGVNISVLGAANVVSANDPNAYSPTSGVNFIEETGELIFSDAAYNTLALNPDDPVNITYTKTGFEKGDINPKVYFRCVEGTNVSEIDGQNIMYEFGINNKVQVNSFAKDILTTGLINDIKDVIRLIESTNVSSKEELMEAPPAGKGLTSDQADERISDENKFYISLFGDKFTQLIGKLDNHSTFLSQENTSIGSRLSRLDLIENRLEDDRVNYEDLKSENDYVDAAETYIRYQSMMAVYNSALQTGAKVIQMTLVNYL